MLPEVFECPQCQRQFVFELVESSEDRSIYCPQCKRYLGEKDINFILLGFALERLAKHGIREMDAGRGFAWSADPGNAAATEDELLRSMKEGLAWIAAN